METYQYEIKLKVEIQAWDESDAFDALQDAFGVGETAGVTVTEFGYKETGAARKR